MFGQAQETSSSEGTKELPKFQGDPFQRQLLSFAIVASSLLAWDIHHIEFEPSN